MANNFTNGYATLFEKALDEQIVQRAVTGWMDANAGQVKYSGGKTVKIPKMSMDGLGDYSRTTGYPQGSVSLTYETMTMTQDRGRQFMLDSMDVDETNFVASAGTVMSEFQRIHVAPEIDAYRLSKLATLAITANVNVAYSYTPSKADIVDTLIDALATIRKRGFRDMPLVIHATADVVAALAKAKSDKAAEVAFTAGGGLQTTVPSIDNVPIIETDNARMVSAITTSATGWAKGASAKDVNFIIMPRVAPIAITKQDNMKIFTPKENQSADAWLMDYRRYHDLWVMDNKVPGIYANIKDAAQ